ncbi:MAG TPA: tripartite tricarboxylate transporter substrate binding protein [Ramlibacter sp.]|nr:tripartite tricarboxylate transporter substrate binding protein [Ramlibacter sp.]
MFSSTRTQILAAALAIASSASVAGPFQNGNVAIVVSTVPGTSTDAVARLFAEHLTREWGVPVIVENRPGASMMVAAAHVAKAAPDGRTLLLGITPFLQAPHLVRRPAYDPVASFTPLAHLFDARLWMAINATIPAKSVTEFVALARKPEAQYSFATPGNGSTPHLNMAVLMQQARMNLLHVPYKAIAPAVMDVATGQVSAVFAAHSDLLPHLQSGKLRILASTGVNRSDLSKEVPTFRESGWAGFEKVGFGGLLAPGGTPAPLAAEISSSIQKVLQRTEVRARLFTLGFEPAGPSTQQAFGRVVREQSEFWKEVITATGVKAE